MKRYVTATGKDGDGDITQLCKSFEYWSPRLKADAINDIETNQHEYWVRWSNYPETRIRVAHGSNTKYLRTDADNTDKNNLDDLPNC